MLDAKMDFFIMKFKSFIYQTKSKIFGRVADPLLEDRGLKVLGITPY